MKFERLPYLLFFFSGASGLIYQVIWVRAFGNVFGNTIYSASLVVAVFMSGLGLGSSLAGGWADRRYASAPGTLLRAYGICELAIGAMGFLVSTLLPRLGDLSAAISTYSRDATGWYSLSTGSYLARYGIAVLLLMPITVAMGGTLTLLIRHLVHRDLGSVGWKIGALYGVNTAGAAVGCFLTDYALIPDGGLFAAQMVAVLLNLIAAFGALRLASRSFPVVDGIDVTIPAAPTNRSAVTESAVAEPAVILTGLALLLAGFAAMGMEIVWYRHIQSLLGPLRSVFSLLLTVILLGIWLGAVGGGYVNRRFGRPVPFYMVGQALFAVSVLGGMGTADIGRMLSEVSGVATTFLSASASLRASIELWINVHPILYEVAIPALLMGGTYPLANASIQHAERAVGRRAGLLYLANTVGAVMGALITGFVLMPALGMQRSVTVLIATTMLGIVPLYAAARSIPAASGAGRPVTVAFVASLIAMGVALSVWMALPSNHVITRVQWPLASNERRLALSEGITEVVTVTEILHQGRRLITNSHPMSATGFGGERYMRAFAHIPLLSLGAPDRVLVIAFGVGNTAHAASLHPSIRRLEVVDLSQHILRHADYFAASNGNVLRDPRVSVYVNDGRHHLRMQPLAVYDLITMEPPPITHAGVASLYSREFYTLTKTRLKPGGYITQWLPVHQVPPAAALSIVRAFIDVFPHAVLLSGFGSELILMGVNDSRLEIDPALVSARLKSAPGVRRDLGRIDLGTLTEIIGTFAGSAETLDEATKIYPPVTDDLPIPEYAVSSRLVDHELPRALFDVTTVAAWCPKCFTDGRPRPEVAGLDLYLTTLGRLYQRPEFLHYRSITGPGIGGRFAPADPLIEQGIATRPYLRLLLRGGVGSVN